MIEPITMYRTNDGKTHDTEKKAKQHICDLISKILDDILWKNEKIKNRFSRQEILIIILAISDNFENLESFYEKIKQIME